ncbi:unnamed protein product [Candidula unifasciata]|uniref:Uncharacterized protein n=1 Tax=Candidula unifasciata TaxID=100452 RepID=A0A8S3ZJ28_9EUPU|nr:unnamed protein product [Candidula unifasciata]
MSCRFSRQMLYLHRCWGSFCRRIVTLSTGKQHLLSLQTCPVSGRSFSIAATASVFTLLLLSQRHRLYEAALISSTRGHSSSTVSSSSGQSSSNTEHREKLQEMSKPVISDKLKTAKEEAVWGLFVADSVAMPVHWYYDPRDIKKDYGKWLQGYVAPNGKHPSSILRLSAVDGSGRGSNVSENSIIGNVILHDKLKYWTGGSSNNHYHQGMAAGDNTLNAVMALHELKTINRFDPDLVKPERDVRGAVLEEYVKFMTTPGTHNDTYAESFHRSFFRDWVNKGKPTLPSELLEFAENRSKQMMQERPDHQLAVVGSLVPAIPWIIRNAHRSEKDCAQNTVDFVKLTHPVPSLIPFIECYSRLLHSVINGRDLKSEIMAVLGHSILGGPGNRDRILFISSEIEQIPKGSEERLKQYQKVIATLGSACYIEGALNSMLFLALQFHDDFEAGVLTNANCGGENCHRGAALGALLAAAAANRGSGVPNKFKEGLNSLRSEIQKVVAEMNQ